jgi:putative nucleotidyltransferase with HDIG domain
MARSRADEESRADIRRRLATIVLWVGLFGCTVLALLQLGIDDAGWNALSVVLAFAAVSAGLFAVQLRDGTVDVSASFIVSLLAAAFLGPASACVAVAIAEVVATRRGVKTRRFAFASNLLAGLLYALASANLIHLLAPHGPSKALGFYLVVAGSGLVGLTINFVVISIYSELLNRRPMLTAGTLRALAPSLLLNIALAVAGAGIYLELGLAGIAFALTAVFAFSYMAQLVERSRHRSEQYVSLSWGVLAGLMRSMDIRDQRAARHAAAVARFAKDMAAQVGMSDADQELAHTAGLLHDIGHFALSDRVAERGRTLTEEDWVAIHRHPDLGADMLRDLGMYGPVAELVLAHHERIDGRGYPNGLPGDEIPEIAKIISVAEVYDTLTASDTYRTRMSSFEALTELRRVSGTQLDGGYVEVLAGLLTGVGVDYRHADTADFDSELDMERRINEAGAGR